VRIRSAFCGVLLLALQESVIDNVFMNAVDMD